MENHGGMSAFWIGFLVGAPVWASLGFFVLACMKMSAENKDSDGSRP